MEIVTAIVTPVVQSLIVPVKKQLGYLISCKTYVRDVRTKRKYLDDKRDNVEKHKNHHERNLLVVPTEVDGWLEKVGKIDEKAASISSDLGSCFNLKHRHKLGRKAFKIIEDINCLIQENNMINWTDYSIALGEVNSDNASTSTPSSHHNDFPSRERTFKDALKVLQPDHKSQMVALCGMGGVGKTTMMEKLKKVAEEKMLFNMIVKVVIGEKTNTIAIQDAVADYLGIGLTEKSESARSDRLRKSFEAYSDGGKKKILVILDDVWQFVDLNDMGLCPLPNQGVGFKLLLTSRDQSVCTRMGVEANSIFKVDVIEELEAHGFFQRFVELPNDDHELHKIGEDIVRKCCGLPIAIKTIACTLKDKSKDAWKDALSRLENHDIDQIVHAVFEMSYKNLQDGETRSIFLLCGLFPEDFNIPKEDLVRYAWGLELLNKVYSMRHARNRLNTCIERLILSNLLIRSQDVGCVKMHDLVREFVLDMYSKGEHTSIVGTMSNRPTKLTSESCKRISLACTGMFEFPRNFKFPNLSLLKLMYGDESLKFPKDFYEDMKQLKVIAYDEMKYPLVSRSLQCSTNLRTLCLHRCLLMFDCSPIGDILNLEVLSFAYCSIQKLPTRIGNLKELKLLDLTGCVNLRIDDGVFINLVKLEELYMKVAEKKGIRFTHANGEELVERSQNLFTLEIEFFENNALPKNISFKKLERFKISLGCYLEKNDVQNRHSFENTLMLVSDKCELLDSRMNELFDKTEVLHFQVNGVNDLGDGLVESLHHQRSSFYNLRVLTVCKCANLRYLFTVCVANGLKKLERLEVTFCPVLETLVDGDNNGVEVIKFQALKFLSFGDLPKLMSLCNVVNTIELPQLEELILDSLPNFTSIYPDNKSATSSLSNDISTTQPFLNKEVVIPQLKKLEICMMERLKEIWPSNPMSLLHHLEELVVNNCDSIEVLFNIDLESVGNIDESSCCLRSIVVWELGNLREVWRIKGTNNEGLTFTCFQDIENLVIRDCKRFRNVFTPTTTNFDMKALTKLAIDHGERRGKRRQEQEINVVSNEEISEVIGDDISNVVFSSHLIHTTFHHVRTLHIEDHNREEAVFEIESPSCRELATTPHNVNNQQPLLPYLKDLEVRYMERMSHVWRCNWNKLLIPQKQKPEESSFHNLTTIFLWQCNNIKYLFSPRMAKLLSNLKKIRILYCGVIEEIVSNRDDEDEDDEGVASMSTNTSIGLLSNLDYLDLRYLPNFKRIGDGGAKNSSNKTSFNIITPTHDQFEFPKVDVAWSFCQYARDIYIYECQTLPCVIPSYALGRMQKLEKLRVMRCEALVEVFETQGFNIDGGTGSRDHNTMGIPQRKNINVAQLSNLRELTIYGCDLLKHVFTFSTPESLMQLQVNESDCERRK